MIEAFHRILIDVTNSWNQLVLKMCDNQKNLRKRHKQIHIFSEKWILNGVRKMWDEFYAIIMSKQNYQCNHAAQMSSSVHDWMIMHMSLRGLLQKKE